MEYSATTTKSEVGVSMYVCEYVWMCANVTFHTSPAQLRGMRKLRFYIDFGIGYTNTHSAWHVSKHISNKVLTNNVKRL